MCVDFSGGVLIFVSPLSCQVKIINAAGEISRQQPKEEESGQSCSAKGSHLPLKGGPSPGYFGAISGLGSGLLRWLVEDRFTPGFKLRFLFPNSSRKQHDDAALSSASPLETT